MYFAYKHVETGPNSSLEIPNFLMYHMLLNKLFLKFLPILYLNRKNIFLNQVNNVKKIISFI